MVGPVQTGRNNSKEALRTFSLDIPLPGIPKKDKVVAACGVGERRGETVSGRRTPKLLRRDAAWTRLGLTFPPPAKLACPSGWAGWAAALGMI